MDNQEQEKIVETVSSENSQTVETPEIESPNKDDKSISSEKQPTEGSNTNNEPTKTRRIVMSQDIRYATEQDDREKLMEKYNQYQTSDSNACHVRFLTDHRQNKYLIDRNQEDQSNLQELAKTFDVNIQPGYQNAAKHSFKIYGTEMNVQKCLIEVMKRMFKTSNEDEKEILNSKNNEEKDLSPQPTSIFVTTINPDSSITEEKKPFTPTTPIINEEKVEQENPSNDDEQLKFVPLERKPEYTFIMLITSQGQEVLKKNWSFFAGPLQQRLNIIVTNPFKLPKFGDKQWQNELAITGESVENITNAVLQLTAFINDVLGIPSQTYNADEEQTMGDQMNQYRNKTSDYSQQRRHDYNNSYRQSPSPHQNQSSPYTNYHERTFFNRGRQGLYEQIILIRNNCVARIVGTRGSTLRRIQGKCHLRDMIVARHANENGYVECTLSSYQARNLNFAIDTIRSYLRNEDDQAIQVLESNYIDLPSQSSPFAHSPHHDQPQLTAPNTNQDYHQQAFPNHRYQQQQQMSFTAPSDVRQTHRETGFTAHSLQFNNGPSVPQPSYNFQNTPSFDFTHRPTSASRKTDKRPGEVTECHGPNRPLNDYVYQHYNGSSSSNSSSVSPRQKSKRTCPETKEIDCTTDEGFWIQKQYYHALDDSSKEVFDSLMEKLEKIRIVAEENAMRKQQRLVGRNRGNKTRAYPSTLVNSTHLNDETNQQFNEKETIVKVIQEELEKKVETEINNDEQQENKPEPTNASDTNRISLT